MAQAARFWDNVALRYSKKPVSDEASYQKKLKITQAYFRPDMEVLELGCGTGSTAMVHAPFVKHIHAVDISAGMLEIARDKVEAAGIDNITFQCAAVDDFTAPDESLDAVLALSLLHLVTDKQAVMARIHRMLKPDGLFVSSTVCLGENMMRYIRFINPLGRALGLMPLVKVFTAKNMEDSVTAAGFEIERVWLPPDGITAFIVARKVGGGKNA
ncbi:class I SAM-dependent methyltransferase [Pelagibius sp.]|uniref:class I SAM-dependent methyltransferase n=1 Tax=Pelagibius sp. TaxID=1931238 RepID=UPI00260A2D50|nr:class I SAM-dependent methyltransferase [Pelagibius sp.]